MLTKCEKTVDDSQDFISFYEQLKQNASETAQPEEEEEINFQSPSDILNFLKKVELELQECDIDEKAECEDKRSTQFR